MSIIDVRSLTKVFGSDPDKALQLLQQGWTKERILKESKQTVGVNRASFSIEAGQIFVIMGLSGSGKSTLLRLLNRLIEPTDGQILFQGKDIVRMNPNELREFRRKRMGMVFQKFALFPHRTVLQNVEYGLEIQGIAKPVRKQMARQSLELVGLGGWEDSYPDALSGGMQQRVGLARGLANDPDILLMDEAFSALDPMIRKDMQDELLQLQSSMQKTIVFITHDLDEALRIGDRIALMKDGSIVQIGTPEEILMKPADSYVEKFIEDVDLSKVLTAAHVMRRPETIMLERGPRVALQLMREQGVSNLYVTDKAKRLLGVITAEGASTALKEGLALDDILIPQTRVVAPDTVLNELFEPMAATPLPLAVTDGANRLLGIVIRGAVFAALAGNAVPEAGGVR
ncbi:quaternary amine ABC transporter ATP-binding protein [Paenibacillus sp. GCM10023250]|uniref:quaternary amine ABC transporter ATP-binding protein n=1 Tax=Paenibacillus sp. GCM10023250 TaxID=3252648 RepID=UPI00361AF282